MAESAVPTASLNAITQGLVVRTGNMSGDVQRVLSRLLSASAAAAVPAGSQPDIVGAALEVSAVILENMGALTALVSNALTGT